MRKGLYVLVILIGFLQTIGYVIKNKTIKNLGVITCASPLPIVFTEVKGIETFASDFYMQWTNDDGALESVKITPQLYARLKGPYNRRNIFGAAIAYGPVLPETVWQPILNYGLCNDILENELQIPVEKNGFSVHIKTRTAGRDQAWTLNTNCNH